jgi:dTDP-4-dehydrorhamnose reductase
MAKPKVVILGATGMLGSITLDSFTRSGDFIVTATYRDAKEARKLKSAYPSVEFRTLDAETASIKDIARTIKGADWVINSIGVIKPYIHDDNAEEVERATRINSLFPHLLSKAAAASGAKVIQIATDCVYSGEKGGYVETDMHDALDVYGKTKSLGEAYFGNIYHLRCSIIGPELKAHMSLMDWFLGQPENSEVNGFSNHQWNGVTTLQYARICQGIIKSELKLSHIQHIVPGNLISKANLLKSFAKEYDRKDIKINVVEAPKVIDRTLSTNNEKLNRQIWKAAGYKQPPTIEEMIAELAKYDFPKKSLKR